MVDWAFGPKAMERFVYYSPKSFFHVGRAHRDKLVEAHGRLDPLIGGLIRDEMRANWWRHLLVSIPLAWCGMWVGGWLGLLLVPLFACACVAAVRRGKPLLLLYAVPALVMLGAARRRRQPIHPLQPDPDRSVLRRRRVAHCDPSLAGLDRALAMAISRASTVINSICARSLRCRLSSISRLITTQT